MMLLSHSDINTSDLASDLKQIPTDSQSCYLKHVAFTITYSAEALIKNDLPVSKNPI